MLCLGRLGAACLGALLISAAAFAHPARAAGTPAPASATSSAQTSTAKSGGAATAGNAPATSATSCTPSPDYGAACWTPADPSNYSSANRAHDYPIDMIVIHDIEGDAPTAIKDFQTPGFGASAHYVVGYDGSITQMVREHDIAWHAGNWDYNTRSIGIEHAGYAYTAGLYTQAEYDASAELAASICSRYGVPMDRTHVIGHYQVPDPNNPNLFGGSDHHTDPGPYWDWTYYMATAQADAKQLPSPPHMMPDPVAVNGLTSVTVTWQPARTCRAADAPITGYTVVGQPGNLSMTLPATATSATFNGLQPGTAYTFTVTTQNSYGSDSATSNAAIPGRCTAVKVSASPASPQPSGTQVQLTATSAGCPNPEYEFWIEPPGASQYTEVQAYSTSPTFSWSTKGLISGTYRLDVWARDANSPGTFSNAWGSWDDYNADDSYSLTPVACTGVTESASPAQAAKAGMTVTVSAAATGCPAPQYEFWIQAPGASVYTLAQKYGPSSTFSWSTTGLSPGTYRINVWVRDASSTGLSSNASGSWDAYNAGLYYSLTAGCPSVSLNASPAGGVMIGTNPTFTASAPGCASPQYEYWVLYPGASLYTLAQPYSPTATFSLATAHLTPGTYRINVWVREGQGPGVYSNASGSWDAYNAGVYYTVAAGCPSVAESATPTSTQVGNQVTITASAPGCPNPQYEFWILYPGASSYTLVRSYGSSGTFLWSTTGLPKGSYRVNVWVRDASSAGQYRNAWGSWDAYNASLYVNLS